MKIPQRLQPLVNDGLIDEVIRPLMSGKEADVYVVRCADELRCAKIYKQVQQRGFKQAAQYQEGRKSRNSRRNRAMEKGSRFGREEQEKAWQNTEADALNRLARAGVRVPRVYACVDGVLLMELITDGDQLEAPRLNDITLDSEQALQDHATMMRYLVRMLCVGLVHGDLSEFNVLQDEQGPVIIDLPQVIDAAANNNAKRFFERDANNITAYYSLFAPELLQTDYAGEIWSLYAAAELQAETELSGYFEQSTKLADVAGLLEEIEAVRREELARLARLAETAPADS